MREAGERHHDNAGGSRKLFVVAEEYTIQIKERHYEKVSPISVPCTRYLFKRLFIWLIGVKYMGFLGTRAGPLADLALIISITSFIILCLGVVYAKKGILLRHFRMTRLAVFLLILAFIWMGPRFIGSLHILISRLTALPILLTVFHVIIGTSALLAGIFLAFDMVIKKTRNPMRTVFLLWILALLLGIATYIVRYILTPLPPR
jgi:hypothetical protein